MLPTSTHPSQSSATVSTTAVPLRGSLKGMLAALVLMMLALILWQLIDQYQQNRDRQRHRSLDYSVQLADRLSLNMELSAQMALNLLSRSSQQEPQGPEQKIKLLDDLRHSLPSLRSIAWLDASGKVTTDSPMRPPTPCFSSRRSNKPWAGLLLRQQ